MSNTRGNRSKAPLQPDANPAPEAERSDGPVRLSKLQHHSRCPRFGKPRHWPSGGYALVEHKGIEAVPEYHISDRQ